MVRVSLRAGSGQVHIGVAEDDVDLVSGSGGLTVGLRPGQTARLDVTTGAGRLHSDLPVEDAAPATGQPITIRARTGSGDVRLFRAVRPAHRTTRRNGRRYCAPRTPGERHGQIAAIGDLDVAEPEPPAISVSSRGRGSRRPYVGSTPRLGERPLHPEHARLPVGLQIDPGDQRLAQQERQT